MDTVLVACQDTFISHVFSWELANLGFAPHICLPCWTSLEGYQRHVLLMTMSETEVKKKRPRKTWAQNCLCLFCLILVAMVNDVGENKVKEQGTRLTC